LLGFAGWCDTREQHRRYKELSRATLAISHDGEFLAAIVAEDKPQAIEIDAASHPKDGKPQGRKMEG